MWRRRWLLWSALLSCAQVLTIMSSYLFDSLASRSQQHQHPIVIAQHHPTSPNENSARLAGCCFSAYERSSFARRLFCRLVPQPRALRCCHMCLCASEVYASPGALELHISVALYHSCTIGLHNGSCLGPARTD
ncbi:hypothetical protein DE146DRAFT_660159 [Phaeosphaeria sp. MPI-PUGE-AT-0046c]|nr:hypothetical protein DE146DRAFT_660159 [Phaeosphaeria sp. MPI-PUGE-AT-0046c]